MIPLRLQRAGRELFALEQPPTARRSCTSAVLLCNPLGHESIRAHRLYRVLGDRLRAGGHHVMRFDYYGSGDSAGDDADFDLQGAVDDTCAVARELLRRSGAEAISLLGLRLGVEVAQLASRALPVDRLVLLEPLVDGAAYLEQLERAHLAELNAAFGPSWQRDAALRAFNRPAGACDLLGFEITASCRAQIIDALGRPPQPRCAGALLVSDDTRARARWSDVPGARFSAATSGVDWTTSDSLHATLVPPAWIELVLRAFATEAKDA